MTKQLQNPSSAAQYLTFVAATGDDEKSVEMRYEDENIWLTQKMMAELYGVTVSAINQHLKKLQSDGELDDSVVKQYLITAADDKNYRQKHYNDIMTKYTEEFKVKGEDLLNKVKEIVNEGNVRRIIVKDKDGKTLVELPLTVGVIGAALAPLLAAVGAIAALVTECTIAVEREE